jgi:hypothetical protein
MAHVAVRHALIMIRLRLRAKGGQAKKLLIKLISSKNEQEHNSLKHPDKNTDPSIHQGKAAFGN